MLHFTQFDWFHFQRELSHFVDKELTNALSSKLKFMDKAHTTLESKMSGIDTKAEHLLCVVLKQA